MSKPTTLKEAQEQRMSIANEIHTISAEGNDNDWTPELTAKFEDAEKRFKETEETLTELNSVKDMSTRASALADQIKDQLQISTGQADDISRRSVGAVAASIMGGNDGGELVPGRDLNREVRNWIANNTISEEVKKATAAANRETPVNGMNPLGGYTMRFGSAPMHQDTARDIMRYRAIRPEIRSGMLAAEQAYLDAMGIETRDMGSEQTGFGLEWVAPAMLSFVEATMVEVGNIRSRATVIRTEGAGELRIPKSDDTANIGELVVENDPTNAQDVPTSDLVLNKFQYSSKLVNVHNTLLLDPSVNSEFYIGRAMGVRVARIQNLHFTAGDGSGKPRGILLDASDSGVALAAIDTLTYDEVVDIFHALDPSYRVNASWEMNDLLIAAVKKVKDSQGQPLWMPGLAPDAPSTILGKPYNSNPDMPTGASAKNILFGDISKYYIRDMRNAFFTRSEHFRFDRNQTSYIMWMFSDGGLVEPTSCVFAQNPAT